MANESGYSDIVSFDTIDPNESAWSTIVSFTTNNWLYLGAPQPEMIFGSFIVLFPCLADINLLKMTLANRNESIEAGMPSIETILKKHDTMLEIIVKNVYDSTFISELFTINELVNDGSWFEFNVDQENPGSYPRKDGKWLWLEKGFKPAVTTQGTTVRMLFTRPSSGS